MPKKKPLEQEISGFYYESGHIISDRSALRFGTLVMPGLSKFVPHHERSLMTLLNTAG